jgi:hypothetical protein
MLVVSFKQRLLGSFRGASFLTPQYELDPHKFIQEAGYKIGGRVRSAWPDFQPRSELQKDRLRAVFLLPVLASVTYR